METDHAKITRERKRRAAAIAAAGSLEQALRKGNLPRFADLTLSEAVVLGLLGQGVDIFFAVFGHGSTEVAEVLRVYAEAGLLRVLNVRSEIEASHAATALRWITGRKGAVVTSIGPGALQALAASLVPASDGLGVWYLFGDETSEDEGPNMQQIPTPDQHSFLRLCQAMGSAYVLHTPLALSTALRRGQAVVEHPYREGPFFLLLPMNVQASWLSRFNLEELPNSPTPDLPAAAADYDTAAELLVAAERVVVRVGGGARAAGAELVELLDLADAVAVLSPMASGVVPYSNPRNMMVGGSKGSICGNYAMENADLLLAVGSRFVCQSDSSRTGYPRVRKVINLNPHFETATHYNRTLPMVGDARRTLRKLNETLRARAAKPSSQPSAWMQDCAAQREKWEIFKMQRYQSPCLHDRIWGRAVLTQPGAIKTAMDWARENGVFCLFDSGDVQANGFQIVEDERPGLTFTETGASYMGFAASALLASAVAEPSFYALAFVGDGSFLMNPQVLLDAVEHGAQGCILLLDNRRMGAISGLQSAQYGAGFATWDSVPVDYTAMASSVQGVQGLFGGYSLEELRHALDKARPFPGLSLVHTPVYYGTDELGGMGVFGRWNVGNWCKETQNLRHEIGL